jgi:hypothetical protein
VDELPARLTYRRPLPRAPAAGRNAPISARNCRASARSAAVGVPGHARLPFGSARAGLVLPRRHLFTWNGARGFSAFTSQTKPGRAANSAPLIETWR